MPKAMKIQVIRMISLLYFIPATTIGDGFANGAGTVFLESD